MKNFSNNLKNSLDFGDIRKDVIVPFKGQKYHDEISRLQIESIRTGRKVLFEDKEFPPNSTSIGPLENLNRLLESTNRYRRSARLKPVEVEWIRVPDLPHLNLTSKQTPHVYFSDGKKSRLKQGKIGNCWFCAVATTLSDYYQSNKDIHNVKHSRFTSEEYFGIFHFRFYHLGEWNDVVIDDKLPTLEGRLIFANSKDPNEFWPALLEKAYAKYLGSYAALDGGCPLNAALHFSGGFSQSYELSEYESEDKIQELFQCLIAATTNCSKSSIVTCSTYSFRDEKGQESEKLGLKTSHAYTFTKVFRHKNVQLVRIRNPWGGDEWMGAWSDYSDEMKSLSTFEKEKLGIDIEDDGEFHMEMKDFVKYFRSVQIVTQEPKEFCIYNVPTHKEEFKGSWKNGLNAGGLTNHYDDYFSKKFEENPQYLIKNIGSFDSKCIIALSQATKDIENRDRLSIGLNVNLVEDDMGTRLGQNFFERNRGKSVGTGSHTNAREVTFALEMKPGATYVVVPSTFKPNQNGQFLLRFVSNQPIRCEVPL